MLRAAIVIATATAATLIALSVSHDPSGREGNATGGIPPGCDIVIEGSIKESTQFTPYEDMRSHLPPAPLNPMAREIPEIPPDAVVDSGEIDGLPVRWAVVSPISVYQYFWDSAISTGITAEAFVAAGGIEFDRDVQSDNSSFADYLRVTLGPRAVKVDVGPYAGALTWADPDVYGTRTHNLYWSDGTYDYALIGDRTAVEMMNLGRRLVCA